MKKFEVTVTMPSISQASFVVEAEGEDQLLTAVIDYVLAHKDIDWHSCDDIVEELEIEDYEEVE